LHRKQTTLPRWKPNKGLNTLKQPSIVRLAGRMVGGYFFEIMKAKGIRENGEVVYFDVIDGVLNCCYNLLTELEVPQGVNTLYCRENLFKNDAKNFH
jgi:hypothetical protein